ncbi:MAG TPA: HAD-IIA family hydrolase [Gemmatimonadales bacterium]|nr:HAD-IIA family hydrolase [Gemmatimonadales bacterium]
MDRSSPSAYLVDLDGTLYVDGAAVPGAVAALARLRDREVPFRLVTNTTSRSRAMLVERLRVLGFQVAPEELFTAPLAAVALARAEGYSRAVPLLPPGAHPDLAPLELRGGTSGHEPPAGWRADVVLIGDLGALWNHELMQEAFEHLMAGAALVALSRDRYWRKDGRLTLDAGPFVAGLEYATGLHAAVAGKPSPQFYASALEAMGSPPPREVAMIGDDLWSDVAGAQSAGVQGWLVRTGKFRPEALFTARVAPDRILDSVAELEGG